MLANTYQLWVISSSLLFFLLCFNGSRSTISADVRCSRRTKGYSQVLWHTPATPIGTSRCPGPQDPTHWMCIPASQLDPGSWWRSVTHKIPELNGVDGAFNAGTIIELHGELFIAMCDWGISPKIGSKLQTDFQRLLKFRRCSMVCTVL